MSGTNLLSLVKPSFLELLKDPEVREALRDLQTPKEPIEQFLISEQMAQDVGLSLVAFQKRWNKDATLHAMADRTCRQWRWPRQRVRSHFGLLPEGREGLRNRRRG